MIFECTWADGVDHSGPPVVALRQGWPGCRHSVEPTPTCPAHLLGVLQAASRPRLATPCPGCGKHSVPAVVAIAGMGQAGPLAVAAAEQELTQQGWCPPSTLAHVIMAAGGEVRVSQVAMVMNAPVRLERENDVATGDVVLRARHASLEEIEAGESVRG